MRHAPTLPYRAPPTLHTPPAAARRRHLRHRRGGRATLLRRLRGDAARPRRPLGSAPSAAPQLGSCYCASSGRAWWLRAARHSQGKAGPPGAPPPPRLLAPAGFQAADCTPPLTAPLASQVATQLLWGDASDLERVRASGPFDLVVGSDLLYAPHVFPLLLDSLVQLCTPGLTEVLLTYPTRYAVADAAPGSSHAPSPSPSP